MDISERHDKLVQRANPCGCAGPTHRQTQALAPRSLPGSGSESWSASGALSGRAHNPGVPAAPPGPTDGVRPAVAQSAGGARGPSSLPTSLWVRPVAPGAGPRSWARELGPSPGHAASGPLPGSAAAPGRGDSPSRRPRAAVSAPRPIWGRSGGGGVNGGENSISAREPWPSVSYPHPPARDTTLGTQILRPRAGTLAPVLGLSGSLPRFCKLRPWASSPHPWTMRRPLLHSKASPLDSEDPPLHGRPHPEPRTRLTERWGLRLDASGL